MEPSHLKVLPLVPASVPAAGEPIVAKKPPVDPSTLKHRDLVRGPFWQKIPAYKDVSEAQFLDHNWQAKNSITKIDKLISTIQRLPTPELITDIDLALKRAPLSR